MAFWRRYAVFAVHIYVLSEIFSGVIRFMLGASGLSSLVYLPKLFLLPLIVVGVLHRDTQRPMFFGLLLSLFFVLVAFCNLDSTAQVVLGLWIVVPFFAGMALPALRVSLPFRGRITLAYLMLACAGVYLNSIIDLPWSGLEYQVSGVTIETARQWYVDGVARLSGFSRASYSAAIQITLLTTMYLSTAGARWKAAIVWTIALYAAVLTTSKGAIMSLVFVVMIRILFSIRKGRLLAWWIICTVLGLQVALPVMSVTAILPDNLSNLDQSNVLFSFVERIRWMWPDSLNLLDTTVKILVGRGFGGIGVPQGIYEVNHFVAGDNMFVYLVVMFGYVAALLLMALLIVIARGLSQRTRGFFDIAIVAIVAAYGIVANMIEMGEAMLLLGAVVSSSAVYKIVLKTYPARVFRGQGY